MEILTVCLLALLVSVSLTIHLRRFWAVYGLHAGKVSVEPFSRVEAVITFFLIFWIIGQCFILITSPHRLVSNTNTGELVQSSLLTWSSILLLLLVPLRARGFKIAEVFGFDRIGAGRAVATGVLLLLSALPLVFASSALVSKWLRSDGLDDPQEIIRIFESAQNPSQRIPIIILALVVAPLAEELVFRGYLYTVLKKYFGPIPSLFFTGILFALVHLNVPSLLPLFLLACILTIAYETSGSLLVPMAMHATFNAVNLLGVLFFTGR
jgi:membrane protease YdiL (CAAX protease family)